MLEKLTICIPVYNDGLFLEKAIRSCADQAGRIIVCDNASTDGTEAICKRLSEELPNVEWIRHNENMGAFENFRYGMNACKTEYFMWLGAHDMIAPGFSNALLKEMEKDPTAGLAVGTIRYIDENDAFLKKVTYSHWANNSRHAKALDRVYACISGLRRECLHFYSIYRIDVLRKAWIDTPSLGFDRMVLARTAGLAPIIYCPDGEMYGREFIHTRTKNEDRDRRVKVIGHSKASPIVKNVLTRNMGMIQAILDAVETPEDLTRAFKMIAYINRRYHNRRYYQKLRLIGIIIGAIIALSLCVYMLH